MKSCAQVDLQLVCLRDDQKNALFSLPIFIHIRKGKFLSKNMFMYLGDRDDFNPATGEPANIELIRRETRCIRKDPSTFHSSENLSQKIILVF